MGLKILMPALSPTMKSGKIAKWTIKEGALVNIGDVLLEVETDKAIMEFESVDQGTLGKILVPEGTEVAIGVQIAWLLESPDEVIPDLISTVENLDPVENIQEPMNLPQDTTKILDTMTQPSHKSLNAYATPSARARAAQLGIDLDSLNLGRQIKEKDVVYYAQNMNKVKTNPTEPITTTTNAGVFELTQMQKMIAQRMIDSKQQVPHFYIETEVSIDKLINLKEDLHLKVKTTLTHWFILAAARAIKQNPLLKNSWINGQISRGESIDISLAVDLPDGLITPVIRNADTLSLLDLVKITTSLIDRARDRKLKPAEYHGGTLTISNMGSWGIIRVFPIINQPQSSIIGIGCSRDKVIISDGVVTSTKIVSITLAGDHRILNGSDGASFLRAFKTLIENPALLLV